MSRAIGETAPIIHDRRAHVHRVPAAIPGRHGLPVPELRVAAGSIHGDADPDVQLDQPPDEAFHANAAAAGTILVFMTWR